MSLSSGYIKSNSMVLHGKCVVVQTFHVDAAWTFAGQSSATALTKDSFEKTGTGGAASLFSRFTLTLPGGAQTSYNQANHYRNAVIPHALSAEYFNDLRQTEHAGNVKVNPATDNKNLTCFFTTVVDIPCLTSQQALPMLLMSGGLSLEIVTASVSEAFYAIQNEVTSYTLSELSLVYEVVQVTPEFKSALVAAKAQNPYLIHVNDRMCIGPTAYMATTRMNVGLGLSSMKGVVFTALLQDSLTVSLAKPKCYGNAGMTNFALYNNGQIFSIPNMTSDDVVFTEMQRCIGRIHDSNITSYLIPEKNTTLTSRRNNYNLGQFLAGCSCETVDDWSFSSQGVPCDQLAIEINGSTAQDANMWQAAQAQNTQHNLYLWVFYDSILVINPDGTCQIRK